MQDASAVQGPSAQSYAVSHLNEADFKTGGLRSYAAYRNLGIDFATNGMATAHVIRFIEPCSDAARQRHFHAVHFQMIYVLKGWIKTQIEGHGEQLFEAGSSWLQPAGIHHAIVDYSLGCELLEVILPAHFETIDV